MEQQYGRRRLSRDSLNSDRWQVRPVSRGFQKKLRNFQSPLDCGGGPIVFAKNGGRDLALVVAIVSKCKGFASRSHRELGMADRDGKKGPPSLSVDVTSVESVKNCRLRLLHHRRTQRRAATSRPRTRKTSHQRQPISTAIIFCGRFLPVSHGLLPSDDMPE